MLGVDVGGTNLRIAAADGSGRPLAHRTEPAGSLTARVLATRIATLAHELCPDGPAAVGIGLPGPVSKDGEVGPLANLPELVGAEARALVEEELGVPVAIDNDVNLAALGEHMRGCGQQVSDLAFISVGTGVGLGIVAEGRLLHGVGGGAGELGTLPLAPDQAAADPSALGPLESVAGGAGLAARWAERRGEDAVRRGAGAKRRGDHAEPRGADGERSGADAERRRADANRREADAERRRADAAYGDVFAAAADGDAAALELLAEQASVLAMAVRAVQALLDPELIVLGGGIGARRDVFVRLGEALIADGLPHPRLEQSTLGDRAGVIGAVEAARAAARTALQDAIR